MSQVPGARTKCLCFPLKKVFRTWQLEPDADQITISLARGSWGTRDSSRLARFLGNVPLKGGVWRINAHTQERRGWSVCAEGRTRRRGAEQLHVLRRLSPVMVQFSQL